MSWRSLVKDFLDKQETIPKIHSIPKSLIDQIPTDSFGHFGDYGEWLLDVDRRGVGFPLALPDYEREAIMRFGGGLPASWAKVFSGLHPDRPPEGLTREQWRERLDAILIFGDRYAHDLERLGWDAERLFAVGQYWQRLDERGIGWFVAEALAEGGKATDITGRWVRYDTKLGAGRTIWNVTICGDPSAYGGAL